jgi:uncharacterized protein
MMNAILVAETEENFTGETVPPSKTVADGNPTSRTWTAAKFESGNSISTGIWSAEPGILKIKSYPVDEVFTVISGRIDVTNDDGTVLVVGAGVSCLLPKGWSGLFHIVEPTRKCFVTASD